MSGVSSPRAGLVPAFVVAFGLILTHSNAAAAVTFVNADLDGGVTPAGWTLSAVSHSGLFNNRLEAYQVNGSAALPYKLAHQPGTD